MGEINLMKADPQNLTDNNLCNKTLTFETSNYEVVVKLLLRYVLAKVIIDNCRGIMSIIFSAFSGIATNINAAGNLIVKVHYLFCRFLAAFKNGYLNVLALHFCG